MKNYNSKLKSLILFLFIFLGFFGFVQVSQAATYYVSPTGTASWANCTNINTPCSPSTAFSSAVAGDTVYFRGGTYIVPNGPDWYLAYYRPSNAGSPGNPIIFEGYQNEVVRFVPSSNSNTNPMLGYHSPSGHQGYITFRKFTVDTTGGSPNGLAAFFFGSMDEGGSATHITVENCILIGHQINDTNTHWGAIMAYSNCSNLTVRNCKIYNWTSGPGADSTGITMWDNTNAIIENNEIYNCFRGIAFVQSGLDNTVRYNYIHDIKEFGIQVWYQNGGNSKIKIYQNILRNIGGSGIFFTAGGDHPNGLVYNNTMYKAGPIAPAQCSNIEIFNNIIWNEATDSEGGCYICHHDSTVDPSIINYNLYWPNLRFGYRIYAGGSYYTSMPWQGYDANSKKQNPSFVNASSVLATGFKLNAGSPALTGGRGGPYATVMGAYITGNEIIGPIPSETPPDTTPPAPPTGVTIS